MENKRRKWSKYEERVVRTYVKKHPENLHYCFFLAKKLIEPHKLFLDIITSI